MASCKINDEEQLLANYLDGMKLLKKRLAKDGLWKDSASGSSCRCCIETISSISHLRLDRENVTDTLGISLVFGRVIHHSTEFCPSITKFLLLTPPVKRYYPSVISNLHLQGNNLTKVQGLEVLANTLRVLCLAQNKISLLNDSADCLRSLRKLGLLDLSNNQIESFSLESLPFPPGLVILDLRDNPVCRAMSYQEILLDKLPKLLNLDGEDFNDDPDEEEFIAEEAQETATCPYKITSEGSEIMESTMTAIVSRSRARVESLLAKISTPRGPEFSKFPPDET